MTATNKLCIGYIFAMLAISPAFAGHTRDDVVGWIQYLNKTNNKYKAAKTCSVVYQYIANATNNKNVRNYYIHGYATGLTEQEFHLDAILSQDKRHAKNDLDLIDKLMSKDFDRLYDTYRYKMYDAVLAESRKCMANPSTRIEGSPPK